MFITALNSIESAKLIGKVSGTTSSFNEKVKDHITRENEVSFISFQNNTAHICGGAQLNYKHVLSVKDCSKRIFSCSGVISAVPLALDHHKSYFIDQIRNVKNTIELVLITVST